MGEEASLQALLLQFKEQKLTMEEQEQIHLYLKQVSQQSHHAIYLRALLYDAGYGVKQDFEMAFILMRDAASKGNSKAIYQVGWRFLEGVGVTTNYDNALQWLRMAADSPFYITEARYDLGRMYELGMGVDKDLAKAISWYEKAAQQGHQKAKEKLR